MSVSEPLTHEEWRQWAALTARVQFPTPREVPEAFRSYCTALITNPIELAVMNRQDELLLVHRQDEFYEGWHIPGSLLCPGETEEQVLERIITREVKLSVSIPVFVNRLHFRMGSGPGENPRGQELSLLFCCQTAATEAVEGEFFSLDHLPPNVLTSHQTLIRELACWLQTR
jgi:ADP-ribose pyrophosphatase YjhB (NUDIX family)